MNFGIWQIIYLSFMAANLLDGVTYVETHQLCGNCIQQLVENQISAKTIN